MLYPQNIEDKIGFNKIRKLLKDKCLGDLGRSNVDKINFTSNFELIFKLTSQTNDFLNILKSGDPFPLSEYNDIKPQLTKASKIDSYLVEEDFHIIKLTLNNIENILKYFKKRENEVENLSILAIGIYLNATVNFEINRVIDERGKLKNNASDILLSIRNEIQQLEFKVRSKSEKLLNKYINDGYSTEESNVTIRNGRLVLPIRSEFKRTTGGFIHDESSSGQTAYIEPSALVEINNEIRTLKHQEQREIVKILTNLTDILRPEIPNILKCFELLGRIDFIRSKALLAIDLDAILPDVKKTCSIQLVGARHPILFLSHRQQNKPVIPLNIQLNHKERILIISGPNAGGKSVCLQTIVLIQYMFQCGLLIPVEEGTAIGIFHRIFIDIGDEQSVENDLSTYSSHLINMKYFVEMANNKTLFLIDEFGTGTEPQFGGAIAESILDRLRKQNTFGIITTHYTNIKKYAEKYDGIINGAMRFDLSKMEPLFQLETGKPGSSFALEISKKIGLPNEIIQNAQKLIGSTHVKFERLISELEQEKKELEDQKLKINKKEKQIETLAEEYENLKSYLENKQNMLIREAKNKANELIKNANREIEKTIRIIKEEKAAKNQTRIARKSLEGFKEKIISKQETNKKSEIKNIKLLDGPLGINDHVRIKNSDTMGLIIKLGKKTAEVAIGDLKSIIDLSRLEKISNKYYKEKREGAKSPTKARKGINYIVKEQAFNNVLDIRGKRAEEALGVIGPYLDEALLLDRTEVRILHGKGDGILRRVLREYLKQLDFISNVCDEHVEHGGAGISVITLK